MPKGKFNEDLIYGPSGQFPFPSAIEGATWASVHGATACPDEQENAIHIGWVSAPQIFIAVVSPSEPSYVSPRSGALDEHALDEHALDMAPGEDRPPQTDPVGSLLLETGDYILLETGDKILTEAS